MNHRFSRASSAVQAHHMLLSSSPDHRSCLDDPRDDHDAAVSRGRVDRAPASSSPPTARQAAAQLHQLVRDVDEAGTDDVRVELLAPLLRVVEELSAWTSTRAVLHSDPASVGWVLIQRAADHFGRVLADHAHGERIAPVSLQQALSDAQDVAASVGTAPEPIEPGAIAASP